MLSPDGDGRGDAITIRYRLSEPSNALLLVNGKRRWRTSLRVEGAIPWRPRLRRPGLERLQLQIFRDNEGCGGCGEDQQHEDRAEVADQSAASVVTARSRSLRSSA